MVATEQSCVKGERDSKGKVKHSGPRTEMDKVVPKGTKIWRKNKWKSHLKIKSCCSLKMKCLCAG